MVSVTRRSLMAVLTSAAILQVVPMSAAAAGDALPRVIEMFTSQGCSSCPPADKLLKTFAGQREIIALSFHVDYWDRLGWKDTFGSSAFTQRQQAYARKRGDGQVYTPQAVVNGQHHEVGHNKSAIERRLAATTNETRGQSVTVTLSVRDGKLLVQAAGSDGRQLSEGAVVTLLGVQSQGSATATRGENAGQTLSYINIVRATKAIGTLSGVRFESAVALTDAVLAGGDAAVVLVQRTTDGPVLGAAQLRLR